MRRISLIQAAARSVLQGGGGAAVNEAPGFHDVTPLSMCRHPEHGMPTHLYIPPGKKYVHYCPQCGHKNVAFGSSASL